MSLLNHYVSGRIPVKKSCGLTVGCHGTGLPCGCLFVLACNLPFQNNRYRTRPQTEKKRGELYAKKAHYDDLMQRYDKSECDMEERVVDRYNDFREQIHSANCRKCSYLGQAKAIEIQVHEWPLPKETLEAQSTVFELKLPPWFGFWRDTALYLLLDVLEMSFSTEERPREQYPLSGYSGLQAYFEPYDWTRRLGLLSPVKPHGNTHRKHKLIIHVTKDEICLDNALHYQYHDSRTGAFVNSMEIPLDHIPDSCMFTLPQRASS